MGVRRNIPFPQKLGAGQADADRLYQIFYDEIYHLTGAYSSVLISHKIWRNLNGFMTFMVYFQLILA